MGRWLVASASAECVELTKGRKKPVQKTWTVSLCTKIFVFHGFRDYCGAFSSSCALPKLSAECFWLRIVAKCHQLQPWDFILQFALTTSRAQYSSSSNFGFSASVYFWVQALVITDEQVAVLLISLEDHDFKLLVVVRSSRSQRALTCPHLMPPLNTQN